MKNIIIGGTVRSGKTTLSNLIRERFGYSKVESDTIVNAFDEVFPEMGITHRNADLARKKYEPFLFEILNGFYRDLKYTNNITVFPGSQFLPENIYKYEKKDKYIVILLSLLLALTLFIQNISINSIIKVKNKIKIECFFKKSPISILFLT